MSTHYFVGLNKNMMTPNPSISLLPHNVYKDMSRLMYKSATWTFTGSNCISPRNCFPWNSESSTLSFYVFQCPQRKTLNVNKANVTEKVTWWVNNCDLMWSLTILTRTSTLSSPLLVHHAGRHTYQDLEKGLNFIRWA